MNVIQTAEGDGADVCGRAGLAGWNQTPVAMLEHHPGGSCELWGWPGEPGAHYQHCWSHRRVPPARTKAGNGSEGGWRGPSWGGTRHCVDTPLSKHHVEGALSLLEELLDHLPFQNTLLEEAPDSKSGHPLPSLPRAAVDRPVYRITTDGLRGPADPLGSNQGSRAPSGL